MDKESIATDQVKPCWFIDVDWYQRNNRSFFGLAQGCLCSKCQEGLKGGEVSAADLMARVRDCCSKKPGFISGNLPILESIFRLFLANDNQPLDAEEVSGELVQWRGGDAARTSAEILSHLLESDQYYGLKQVQE